MTGGAENFSVNSNLKNVLHKGLVKTSLSTSKKFLNFNNKKNKIYITLFRYMDNYWWNSCWYNEGIITLFCIILSLIY
jgi:hypothetical protein